MGLGTENKLLNDLKTHTYRCVCVLCVHVLLEISPG